MSHNSSLPKSTDLQPMIYVCVASAFNLPELESCLLRRPQYLVLVVSDFIDIQQGALLLKTQLQRVLPGIKILCPHQDTQTSFDGRDVASCLQWASQTLLPYLNALPDLPRVCNITGGSKAITMALINEAMHWQWLDYKAENKQSLQRLVFNQGLVQAQQSEFLPSARPETVARLYSSKVTEKLPNRLLIEQSHTALQIAKSLWAALSHTGKVAEQRALLELFGTLETGLESIWLHKLHSDTKEKTLRLSSQSFIGQAYFTAEHLNWLQQWQQLAPQAIEFSESSIKLPSYHSKDDFKRWLSGDWLEQLVMHWLTEKIRPEEMVANLKINPLVGEKSSLGERETDIVVHTQGRTTVIEVKTDLPPNGKIRDLLEQITSLGDRLGRTRKILLIGPQLYKKIHNDLADIQKRCKADQVILCYSKAMLLEMF